VKNIKSTAEIYKTYPSLFPKNCITCESGWYDLIDQMSFTIQLYSDNEANPSAPNPEFVYIREKFGVLDIEIKNTDAIIDLLIAGCTKLSFHTCEFCGDSGELYCSSKHRQWSTLKTLCLDHAIELYYYRLYREAKE